MIFDVTFEMITLKDIQLECGPISPADLISGSGFSLKNVEVCIEKHNSILKKGNYG